MCVWGGVHSPDSVNSMAGGLRDLNTVLACEYSYLSYIVYIPVSVTQIDRQTDTKDT